MWIVFYCVMPAKNDAIFDRNSMILSTISKIGVISENSGGKSTVAAREGTTVVAITVKAVTTPANNFFIIFTPNI